MADEVYSTVSSGQAVSGAFSLERPDRTFAVQVPSLSAATQVQLQFGATSGGPFFALQRPDGSGLPFTVYSGAGPGFGIVPYVPTPWGQISLTGSQSDTRTFTLLAMRRA